MIINPDYFEQTNKASLLLLKVCKDHTKKDHGTKEHLQRQVQN